jgi:hypothetical protein
MEQTPPAQLQKLFTLYTTVIRPKMEDQHKKLGINLQENIISESINSKDGRQNGSREISNNK